MEHPSEVIVRIIRFNTDVISNVLGKCVVPRHGVVGLECYPGIIWEASSLNIIMYVTHDQDPPVSE